MDHLCNDHSTCYGDHTDLEHRRMLIPGIYNKICFEIAYIIMQIGSKVYEKYDHPDKDLILLFSHYKINYIRKQDL